MLNENWKEDRLKTIKQIAIKKGGRCLSEEYVNGITKLEFECSKGHTWKAIPQSIITGSWCGECYKKRGT